MRADICVLVGLLFKNDSLNVFAKYSLNYSHTQNKLWLNRSYVNLYKRGGLRFRRMFYFNTFPIHQKTWIFINICLYFYSNVNIFLLISITMTVWSKNLNYDNLQFHISWPFSCGPALQNLSHLKSRMSRASAM